MVTTGDRVEFVSTLMAQPQWAAYRTPGSTREPPLTSVVSLALTSMTAVVVLKSFPGPTERVTPVPGGAVTLSWPHALVEPMPVSVPTEPPTLSKVLAERNWAGVPLAARTSPETQP